MLLSLPCEGERLRLGLNSQLRPVCVLYPPLREISPLLKGLAKADLRIEPPDWVFYPVPERTGRLLTGTY